jgi:hypothetical protein
MDLCKLSPPPYSPLTTTLSEILYDNFDTPEKIQAALSPITAEIQTIKNAISDITARKDATVTTSDGTFTFLNLSGYDRAKSRHLLPSDRFSITFDGVLKIKIPQTKIHSSNRLFGVLYPPHEGLVELLHHTKCIINDTTILNKTTPVGVGRSVAEAVQASLRYNIPFDATNALISGHVGVKR